MGSYGTVAADVTCCRDVTNPRGMGALSEARGGHATDRTLSPSCLDTTTLAFPVTVSPPRRRPFATDGPSPHSQTLMSSAD